MRYRIWLYLVPQIMKELSNSLYNCKARYEVITYKNEMIIHDIVGFNLIENEQYQITINTENNTKTMFIHRDNVKMFTFHLS